MNKLFYLLIFLIFSFSIVLAEDMLLQNTKCSEYSVADSEYELTYEEKMEIASSYFESEINKNEQACDSNFTTTNKNTSASGSSGGSSSVAGGITGQQTLENLNDDGNNSSSFGSNTSLNEDEQEGAGNSSNTSENNKNITENGKIPECIARIEGDDEIAMQIKESISMVSDEEQKKALIKAYSDYKGLNIDPDKC